MGEVHQFDPPGLAGTRLPVVMRRVGIVSSYHAPRPPCRAPSHPSNPRALEIVMTSYLKIVDLQGDMLYVNPHFIISIRPGNRKSFRDSGAEIKVTDGTDAKSLFTEAGPATKTVIDFLGIPED